MAVKIGLVTESFDRWRGGAEAWTYRHALNLLLRGYDVHVVAKDVPVETERLPITIHRLEQVSSPLRLAAAAEAKLRALKLDLIHDMGMGWHYDIFQPHGGCWTAISAQKLTFTPSWLRPLKRRIDPLLPRYRQHQSLSQRQTVAEGQILLALSHKVAEEFLQYQQVPPDRIRVVYNGVDIERFSPQRRDEFRRSTRQRLGIPDDVVVAVAVAHNFRLKGVPTLLKALEILTPKRLPLHVIVVGGKHLPVATECEGQRIAGYLCRLPKRHRPVLCGRRSAGASQFLR